MENECECVHRELYLFLFGLLFVKSTELQRIISFAFWDSFCKKYNELFFVILVQ